MCKSFKILLLQSENLSKLCLFKDTLYNKEIASNSVIYKHLYIVSDDEIKEEDWVLNSNTNNIAQYKGYGSMDWWKKIIATTDTSLGLPLIPDSFLPIYVKSYNDSKNYDEIIKEVDLEMDGINPKIENNQVIIH